MKRKIVALGLFALCTLAVFAGESQAWPFLPHSPWHRHNRYATHITCRPYNAFTPICWGNLVCDGCCPSPCGVASGCLPMQIGVPPWAMAGGCCMASGCGMPSMGHDFSHASDMPMMHHSMPMPSIHSNPYTAPIPNPIPLQMPAGPGATMMHPSTGVSQANYHPMYMPQAPNYYMPTYYNPYQAWQPTPYYWYGYGR